MSKLLVSVVLISLMAACGSAGTPAANPFGPQPGDEAMTQGPAEIASAAIAADPSAPGQVMLALGYKLPDPNPEVRRTFLVRSALVASLRRFLDQRGYVIPRPHPTLNRTG